MANNLKNTVKINSKNEDFIIPMTFDVMYEQIFTSFVGMPILEYIIATFNHTDLKKVKGNVILLPKELPQNSVIDTRSRSDLLAIYGKNKFIVEMNSAKNMNGRNVFYSFKVASSGIKINNGKYVIDYNTVLINFNTYKYAQRNLVEMITMRYSDGTIYNDVNKIYEINMAKVLDSSYNYRNELEENVARICKVLMAKSVQELTKETEKIMTKEESKKIVTRARELSHLNDYVKLFDGDEEDNYEELIRNTELAEAEENGRRDGILQSSKENAKKAIDLGLDIETVSKITGLSIEEIKNLK